MPRALTLLWLLATLLSVITTMSATAAAARSDAKIEAGLLRAIGDDPDSVRADIMVQLESSEQATQRLCGDVPSDEVSRAQRASCMVDALQSAAEEAQQAVKDLLAQHPDAFTRSRFLWINNSVSLNRATGSLILLLAELEAVVSIRPEQIFHLQDGSN